VNRRHVSIVKKKTKKKDELFAIPKKIHFAKEERKRDIYHRKIAL